MTCYALGRISVKGLMFVDWRRSMSLWCRSSVDFAPINIGRGESVDRFPPIKIQYIWNIPDTKPQYIVSHSAQYPDLQVNFTDPLVQGFIRVHDSRTSLHGPRLFIHRNSPSSSPHLAYIYMLRPSAGIRAALQLRISEGSEWLSQAVTDCDYGDRRVDAEGQFGASPVN